LVVGTTFTFLLVGCGTATSSEAGAPAITSPEPTDPAPADGANDAGDGTDAGPRSGSISGPDVGPAVDAFDAALAAAVCSRLAACCSNADYAAFFQGYAAPPFELEVAPLPAACAATLSTTFGKLHKKWAGSAQAGRITFSSARAQTCVSGISSAACGVPLTTALFDAACFGTRGSEVFTKIAPPGAACKDIKDGTFYGECDPKLGFCGSAGKCEAWRKTGEDCGVIPTRMFCAPALSCMGGSPSAPGKCSGEPINRQIGESCAAVSGPLELCAAGSYCEGDTGKCTATKPNGAACKYDEECVTNHPYSCSPFGGGTCGSDSFCKTPGTK